MERLATNYGGDARLIEVAQQQQRPVAKPIYKYFELCENRDESIRAAFASGAYGMREIGEAVGLHYSRVSRIINKIRGTEQDLIII